MERVRCPVGCRAYMLFYRRVGEVDRLKESFNVDDIPMARAYEIWLQHKKREEEEQLANSQALSATPGTSKQLVKKGRKRGRDPPTRHSSRKRFKTKPCSDKYPESTSQEPTEDPSMTTTDEPIPDNSTVKTSKKKKSPAKVPKKPQRRSTIDPEHASMTRTDDPIPDNSSVKKSKKKKSAAKVPQKTQTQSTTDPIRKKSNRASKKQGKIIRYYIMLH